MQGESRNLYQWLLTEFSSEGRKEAVEELSPHLEQVLHPGDRVLDLCCGTGPFAFRAESLGARVVALDAAPFMIAAAQEVASERGSDTAFRQADVLDDDLGQGEYELAMLLGNSVEEFSHADFSALAMRVADALVSGGAFLVHYLEGFFPWIAAMQPREYVQQREPVLVTAVFREYLPELGAYVETYRNEDTGETCDYTHYLYTPALVHLLLQRDFDLETRARTGDYGFIDLYRKRP